mgnify:CR=1 FL=1
MTVDSCSREMEVNKCTCFEARIFYCYHHPFTIVSLKSFSTQQHIGIHCSTPAIGSHWQSSDHILGFLKLVDFEACFCERLRHALEKLANQNE